MSRRSGGHTVRGLLPVLGRSWILSRSLLKPAEHPVHNQMVRQGGVTSLPIWGGLVLGLLSCCGLSMLMVNVRASFNALFFTFLFTISTGVAVGWAVSIAAALVRERERNTYDVLCVTPDGPERVDWAICTGRLHRDDTLHWMVDSRMLFVILLFTAIVMLLFSTALGSRRFDPYGFTVVLVTVISVGITTYLDLVQSLVLCGLVGMWVPRYARTGLDARLWAAGGFLLLQVVTFIAAILTDRFFSFGTNSPSGLLAGMAVFYLFREIVIAAFWQRLRYEWNSGTDG